MLFLDKIIFKEMRAVLNIIKFCEKGKNTLRRGGLKKMDK
jgi:hypothetical protein